MKPAVLAASGLALTLVLGGPAAAQSAGGDGWDVETDPAHQATVASVVYDGGVGVAVQCKGATLDVILLGLPAATAGEVDASGNRILQTGPTVEALEQTVWRTQVGATAAAGFLPARRARGLKRGGELIVQTTPPDAATHPRRLRIPLPSDASGIDQVLTACGRKLSDPHDDLPLASAVLTPEMWTQSQPFRIPFDPAHPEPARVEVSCVVQPLGRVDDCEVESESRAGLGDQLLQGASAVRIGSGDPAGTGAVVGRVIYLVVVGDSPPQE